MKNAAVGGGTEQLKHASAAERQHAIAVAEAVHVEASAAQKMEELTPADGGAPYA